MPQAFADFGADIEAPGVLRRVVDQVAQQNEIILVSGDGSSYASPTALNTVLQFRDLGHTNVLYLSDSPRSCERLRMGVADLKCVWSSRIPTTRPPHDGLCVKKYWDMRFFFYDLRSALAATRTERAPEGRQPCDAATCDPPALGPFPLPPTPTPSPPHEAK